MGRSGGPSAGGNAAAAPLNQQRGRSPASLGVELVELALRTKSEAQVTAIRLLLGLGADVGVVNEQGETALYLLVKANHLEAAKAVLEQPGCEPNRVHVETGRTAVHLAYAAGHLGMVRLLLRRGAGGSLLAQDAATFTKAALYPR